MKKPVAIFNRAKDRVGAVRMSSTDPSVSGYDPQGNFTNKYEKPHQGSKEIARRKRQQKNRD